MHVSPMREASGQHFVYLKHSPGDSLGVPRKSKFEHVTEQSHFSPGYTAHERRLMTMGHQAQPLQRQLHPTLALTPQLTLNPEP